MMLYRRHMYLIYLILNSKLYIYAILSSSQILAAIPEDLWYLSQDIDQFGFENETSLHPP